MCSSSVYYSRCVVVQLPFSLLFLFPVFSSSLFDPSSFTSFSTSSFLLMHNFQFWIRSWFECCWRAFFSSSTNTRKWNLIVFDAQNILKSEFFNWLSLVGRTLSSIFKSTLWSIAWISFLINWFFPCSRRHLINSTSNSSLYQTIDCSSTGIFMDTSFA